MTRNDTLENDEIKQSVIKGYRCYGRSLLEEAGEHEVFKDGKSREW